MSIIVQLLSFLLLLLVIIIIIIIIIIITILTILVIFAGKVLKKGLNPCPSLSSVAKDDWKQFEWRVTNPSFPISLIFKEQEEEKKRKYQRGCWTLKWDLSLP